LRLYSVDSGFLLLAVTTGVGVVMQSKPTCNGSHRNIPGKKGNKETVCKRSERERKILDFVITICFGMKAYESSIREVYQNICNISGQHLITTLKGLL
jgi:hypothetical protein